MKHQAQNSIEKMINQNQQSCSKGLILGKYLYSCSTIREEMVRKQIICIGLKKLKQIVNEYKKQVLSEEDLVCAVKSSSLQHRQIELHNNQMQLPSELAYLNRIKQNNQRVLKNKIKQLEGRLIFNQNKQIYVSHIQEGSTEEIRELKRSLQSKDRKIQEYRRLIDNLERKKGQLQSSAHKLKAQSEKMKQKFEQDKKKMQKYKFQLDEIKNKQRTSKKIHHKCSITHNLEVKIYPSIQFHESKVQQGGKQYQFKQQMVSLYTTNSILRKQLIQMHDLLDEQDSKYQNKLQYLQNKIKKLTQFNSQRLYKQDLNSSTYSTQPINTVTPRKRNSDMIDYKYINKTYANQEDKEKQRENLHVKKDKSRVIRLADFQIELELGNEHPKRANNIRYKPMQINVQSSSSYNKN